MHNLLENWKQECYLLSTSLIIINKSEIKLARKDVDSIYKIFSDFFGVEYFNVNRNDRPSITKSNWLHNLLVSHNRAACIVALFETANILLYLKTLDETVQTKFKSTLNT